ncbi:hypothetical protein MUY27_02265 [Mucilaginibacter sp. RS28]|uniref:Uncharacterized protein n=1 Tax=Mucilaginibacter straminoryzae TaxID=2932774 RepID=A0A9X2B7N1_9SPHI|nr:hypothetical protein [Mucilaginibacter straminoryzae]MCJ8208516.1 hypothetical protein [Mucilaginibacter straminoryzae]
MKRVRVMLMGLILFGISSCLLAQNKLEKGRDLVQHGPIVTDDHNLGAQPGTSQSKQRVTFYNQPRKLVPVVADASLQPGTTQSKQSRALITPANPGKQYVAHGIYQTSAPNPKTSKIEHVTLGD